MRTWKQGVVGIITLSNSESIYVHCHKYPYAFFYKKYDPNNNKLETYIFAVMVKMDVVRNIIRIGNIELTKEEEKQNEGFLFNSRENTIEIINAMNTHSPFAERLYALKEVEDAYYQEKHTVLD